MGICSKCNLRTVSQDCNCLQTQLQQAEDRLATKLDEINTTNRLNSDVLRRERDTAIERGKRLWLLASIHQSDHRWWIKTCEYWQRQADAARTDGAISAARDDFWNLLTKLDERAEAAEIMLQKHHYKWSCGNRYKEEYCPVCEYRKNE